MLLAAAELSGCTYLPRFGAVGFTSSSLLRSGTGGGHEGFGSIKFAGVSARSPASAVPPVRVVLVFWDRFPTLSPPADTGVTTPASCRPSPVSGFARNHHPR